jgi:hypothetical protein
MLGEQICDFTVISHCADALARWLMVNKLFALFALVDEICHTDAKNICLPAFTEAENNYAITVTFEFAESFNSFRQREFQLIVQDTSPGRLGACTIGKRRRFVAIGRLDFHDVPRVFSSRT